MNKQLQIALAADSNYLVQATVVLQSLFENNSDIEIIVNFLYLPSKTKSEDIELLKKFVTDHGHSFVPLSPSGELIDILPEFRYTKSAFLRLLLPEIVSPEVEKMLYVDADIVVNGNIWELYNTNIDDYYLAAVKEATHIYLKSHLEKLNIEDGHFYFGSGVVLLNLKKMRQDRIIDKFVDFAKNNQENIFWPDQDVLNAVLWRKVKFLPPKYNFNFFIEKDIASQIWNKAELREVYSKPVIIHYIGPIKPWSYISFHPKTKIWWYHLNKTSYKGFKPNDKSFRNFLKKCYILPYRRFELCLTLKQKQLLGKLIPTALKHIFKKRMLKK